MSREIIRINAGDEPVRIHFEPPDNAKSCTNSKGVTEFQHFVNGDAGLLYLPEEAHQDLTKIAPTGGLLEVSKRWIGRGTAAWLFEPVTLGAKLPEKKVAVQRRLKPTVHQPVNGANALKPAAQPQAQERQHREAKYIMPPCVAHLAGCIVAAVKAIEIAGDETGCALLDARTIQALATTLYIQHNKEMR